MYHLTNNYNFMELLKDYGQVPQTENSRSDLLINVKNTYEKIATVFQEVTTNYDFMDLVKDQAHVQQPTVNVASIMSQLDYRLISTKAKAFVDTATSYYTFMDMLKDHKKHRYNASNDNSIELDQEYGLSNFNAYVGNSIAKHAFDRTIEYKA